MVVLCRKTPVFIKSLETAVEIAKAFGTDRRVSRLQFLASDTNLGKS